MLIIMVEPTLQGAKFLSTIMKISVFIAFCQLYIFTEAILREKHNRIGNRPYMLEIPPMEAQDIDEEHDFIIAELLYKQINQK